MPEVSAIDAHLDRRQLNRPLGLIGPPWSGIAALEVMPVLTSKLDEAIRRCSSKSSTTALGSGICTIVAHDCAIQGYQGSTKEPMNDFDS
ncbi:hypothetical protein J1614_008885 [Plenodomus biglobosus]|nr:hypothetical protein J1614_008885 [Plenodomus biglobosus]